jgi:GDP/UDP-N,N'-diacetylbacillosamine 2-epimerase (hydrolysing)
MVVTGIRSEYFLLEPLLQEIYSDNLFELQVVVTGAHLSHRYGSTVRVIEESFGETEKITSLFDTDEPIGRVKGLGLIVMELSELVCRKKPDFLLVLGDREESLAVATVGNYLNVPVVHLSGGDRAIGNVDDHVRHAVTKLAHIHCAFTGESGRRIIQMGEEPWRVHVTGSPGLDGILKTPFMSVKELENSLKIKLGSRFFVVIQHPISSEIVEGAEQVSATLQSIVNTGVPAVVIRPNSDAGSHRIIDVIGEYTNNYDFIYSFSNLPRLEFVNLLRQAVALVGNSSAGIHEAPFLKLPAVNIGNRQKEREHSTNVVFVHFDVETITFYLRKLLEDKNYREVLADCDSPYGDGKAVPRIKELIKETKIDNRLLYKEFIDLNLATGVKKLAR